MVSPRWGLASPVNVSRGLTPTAMLYRPYRGLADDSGLSDSVSIEPQMPSATIKLFLPFGDPKRLRTAEISNWSGKAIAAPRIEFDQFLARDEMAQAGIYILTGADAETGKPKAYVGEAEVLRDRLKSHRGKEFWVAVVAFFSKDQNLTKSHIRFLEGEIIESTKRAGRFEVENAQASGSKLPESDAHDMQEFLVKLHQLLPVLGFELLTPVVPVEPPGPDDPFLYTSIKGLKATGRRTPDGFVVMAGSEAVLNERPGTADHGKWIVGIREELMSDGSLVPKGDRLVFARDVEFKSPSGSGAVIHGGTVNGNVIWKDASGRTLKEIDERE